MINKAKATRKRPTTRSRARLAIVPSASGWAIRRVGSTGPCHIFGTKREAENAAREMIRASRGGEIVVRGRDGRIQGVDTYVFDRESFETISAVEGIHLTKEMRNDLLELDRQGLSPEARRRWLLTKYGRSPA
jgi:hypothetical protein